MEKGLEVGSGWFFFFGTPKKNRIISTILRSTAYLTIGSSMIAMIDFMCFLFLMPLPFSAFAFMFFKWIFGINFLIRLLFAKYILQNKEF